MSIVRAKSKKEIAAIPILIRIMMWAFPPIAGLISLQVGKSAGYDFLVYHYYNGYAFLTGRTAFDILPAGRQSFFNPAPDIILYEMVEHLPARLTGFLLGAIHGLNFVLVAAIASCVLSTRRTGFGAILPILLAAAGFFGAVSFALVGSFHHDNLVSIFFLLALLIVCRQAQTPAQLYGSKLAWHAGAGASVGVGLGFKLTLAPFAAAILCAPIFYACSHQRRLGAMIAFGAGALIGLLATAGFHMARLYSEYGNPIFPMFSHISTPPFDQFIDGRDLRYQPGGIFEALFYPLYFSFNPDRVSEFFYRDFRLPVAFIIALIFLLVLMWRLMAFGADSVWKMPPAPTVFVGVVAISYVGWLCTASVYRYAVPLELLSFVIIALLLFDILPRRPAAIVLIALAAFIVPTTERLAIGRLPWKGERFVVTRLPAEPLVQTDAIVLLAGANAGTYFIAAFPPSVRFLGISVIDTWLPYTGEGRGPPATESMLGPFPKIMHKLVASHSGQILGVFQSNEMKRAVQAFLSYGLVIQTASCGIIQSNIASANPLNLCTLVRP